MFKPIILLCVITTALALPVPANATQPTNTNSSNVRLAPDGKPIYRSDVQQDIAGEYWVARANRYRRCIVHRESGGDYQARNKTSSAAGAYQMLQSTWDVAADRANRPDLIGRDPATVSKEDQDRLFWVLWDRGNGKHHWSARWAGYACYPGDVKPMQDGWEETTK